MVKEVDNDYIGKTCGDCAWCIKAPNSVFGAKCVHSRFAYGADTRLDDRACELTFSDKNTHTETCIHAIRRRWNEDYAYEASLQSFIAGLECKHTSTIIIKDYRRNRSYSFSIIPYESGEETVEVYEGNTMEDEKKILTARLVSGSITSNGINLVFDALGFRHFLETGGVYNSARVRMFAEPIEESEPSEESVYANG